MEKGTINTSFSEKVLTITFEHPAGNSFTAAMLQWLADAIKRADENPEVKLIVLQSEGDRAFCGGASFNELTEITDLDSGKKYFSGFADVINSMRKCSKLIIGRVQGKAVGGGVGLIAAADYCFATEKASVKLSEFSIGIGPFVIAPAVQRKIGTAALSELTLDAENWKNAYWAKEKGLFQRVFENDRDMDEAVHLLTRKLAKYNPEAMASMKRILWKGTENWDTLLYENAAISGKLVLSPFTQNVLNDLKK